MKLFLTSRTIMPNLVNDFEKFTGLKIKGLKVAFIIDAFFAPVFNTPEQIEKYTKEDTEEVMMLHNWELDVIRLETESNLTLDRFQKHDVIYFNGGLSGHLARVLIESDFVSILPHLLEQKVFVGSSGGSMVFSDEQDAATWYPGEPDPEAATQPGLGLIDFQIFPHYSKDKHAKLINELRRPDLTYYLLSDQAAIAVDDDEVKVCGKGYEILEKAKV